MTTRRSGTAEALHARLRPLYWAVALQGVMLWTPIEKLFLDEIGFTAASVGLMAAAYAVVTPILEMPSGILADRWSRRGVLLISAVALLAASVIGGSSNGVGMYVVSAMVLGAYFAMFSGTLESVVYDLVLEVTGSSDGYEATIGRMRFLEALSLVVSSVAGGWLAAVASPRLAYFVSVPFTALAVLAYSRFQEPRLHQEGEHVSLRSHVALTVSTMTRRGDLMPVILLGALTALIAQVIFEFGPLWLVALTAPAVLFGPYWAGLVSTLGLGGLIAARCRLDKPVPVLVAVVVMVTSSLVLSISANLLVVVLVQIVLALLLAAVTIHVSALLHDSVPSSIRAGVASGVSTASWIGFLPIALVGGWAASHFGVQVFGWVLSAATVLAGILLVRLTQRSSREVSLEPVERERAEAEPTLAAAVC